MKRARYRLAGWLTRAHIRWCPTCRRGATTQTAREEVMQP